METGPTPHSVTGDPSLLLVQGKAGGSGVSPLPQSTHLSSRLLLCQQPQPLSATHVRGVPLPQGEDGSSSPR